MTTTDDYIRLSWEDVDNIVTYLGAQIRRTDYKTILAVSRGGLVPGTLLSHKLGLPLKTVEWSLRDGGEKDLGRLNSITEKYNCIAVDDIFDTGETIKSMKEECFHPFGTAVVLAKKESEILDIVGKRIYNEDKWVYFPWEEFNEYKYI